MPNRYRNSSAIAKIEDEKNYIPNEQLADSTEQKHRKDAIDDANDWYYGTEELLDALPKTWTRSLLYALVVFTAIALPWAVLSKVDETGSARGRIEPLSATQRLDSIASGSVIAVKAKEGEKVKAGQILLELDSEIMKNELGQSETKLEGLQNRLAQLEVVKNQLTLAIRTQEQQNQANQLEKTAQINQAQENLNTKQSTYNLQKLEKQALVNQAKQEINTTQNDQKSAQGIVSIDSRQVDRFSQLVKDGAVSANQVDQLKKQERQSKQQYEKAQADAKQAQLRLAEEMSRYQAIMNQLESDIAQAKLRLQEQKSSYQSVVQTGKLALLKIQEQIKGFQPQISSLESEIAQTKSQIASIKIQLQQRVLRSPINGVIFDLPIDKPGSVVKTGETIAQIAPENASLTLKAEMPSNQSGFLKVGMPVKIKFDAYPFQDYGVMPGRVNWISPDSKVKQTNQGNIETFELKISLPQSYIQAGNKRIPITPGQTATGEVIVRQRRVIDYILDPFKKLQTGGLEL